jgi:hypothetical protein
MGGTKNGWLSCAPSKAIPIERSFAKMKMMGFAEGLNPSYGLREQ